MYGLLQKVSGSRDVLWTDPDLNRDFKEGREQTSRHMNKRQETVCITRINEVG